MQYLGSLRILIFQFLGQFLRIFLHGVADKLGLRVPIMQQVPQQVQPSSGVRPSLKLLGLLRDLAVVTCPMIQQAQCHQDGRETFDPAHELIQGLLGQPSQLTVNPI